MEWFFLLLFFLVGISWIYTKIDEGIKGIREKKAKKQREIRQAEQQRLLDEERRQREIRARATQVGQPTSPRPLPPPTQSTIREPPRPSTYWPTQPSPPSSTQRTPPKPQSSIRWHNIDSESQASPLAGLHDAFTGAPIDTKQSLYQCTKCKVFYHASSYKILQEVNNSQCVACQTANVQPYVVTSQPQVGKEYTPGVVTLQNYRSYVGQVVTFEGFVHSVQESRRGDDFAVMFENKNWVNGFKLVFFRGELKKVGDKNFIHGLYHKTVRVRGLILNHETFGYEIIISDRSMILGIK